MEYNELYHHGVKGMKWGVRRYQNKDGTLTAAGKKRYEKELARFEKHAAKTGSKKGGVEALSKKKRKKLSEMSESEINARIKRLELEKRLVDLDPKLTAQKERRKKAESFVLDVLTSIGKQTLTNVGSQAATHALGTLINKAAKIDLKTLEKGGPDVDKLIKQYGSLEKAYELRRIVNPQKGQKDNK